MLPKQALICCCLAAAGSAFAGQEVTEISISDWPKGGSDWITLRLECARL